MSSLYDDLAQELIVAIESHPLFLGSGGKDRIEATFAQDDDFLTHLKIKLRKAVATVVISFAFSRNETPRTATFKQRSVGFTVDLYTKRIMRKDRTSPDELIQTLEELIDGMSSPAADDLQHCEHQWQWDGTDEIPDKDYLRWQLDVSIKTRNPVRP